MASEEFGYGDYLKAAFTRRSSVPLLGRLPLNYFFLATVAVLGIANPGFWLLGAAGEMAYLTVRSSTQRFRKLIQGERLLAAQRRRHGDVERALTRIGAESQTRYHRLLAQCRDVLGISETLDDGNLESISRVRTGGLNQLLGIFLRLLTSREVLVATLSKTDRDAVERDLHKLQERFEAAEEDSTLGRSLRGTLDIQRKRIDNLDQAASNLEVIDAELLRIEQQVALILEETAVSGKAEALSDRLDAVTGTLEETNRWMTQNAEIFGSFVNAETTATGLPELPSPLHDATDSSVAE